LKCHQSKAHFNKDLTPTKITPYSHPSKDLYVIGITGTNGKTSVSHLIGEVLKSAGYKPFVLGTLNSGNKDLSTPESADIEKFMRDHLEQGGTHFILEVTSEGIDQARILGIDFNVKLLTNITQDHLDYHKTFENYQQTKLSFMREGNAHKINPQDFKNEPINFTTKLLGHFNLLNIKAAASILRHINISETVIQKTLSSCSPPRGRLETVDAGQQFTVLIDYAHTPDGLENVLNTLKDIAIIQKGRLLVLFGCGGNRDPGRRAKMGKIASDIVDFLVITEDNPRMEDSHVISAEIMTGVESGFQDYELIQNRSKAIEFIINKAQENDVVLLAGKGNETYQVFKTETIHFDDREEAVESISNKLKPKLEAFMPDLCISLPDTINVYPN
jgi:UDP-N-acetylmuramyl tripeptide synthase